MHHIRFRFSVLQQMVLLGDLFVPRLRRIDLHHLHSLDLRAETGRYLCATALGEEAVEGRLKQAARRREIPSASWPLGDDEASNALEILAPEYLGAARSHEPGQVPVLVVDQDNVVGFCVIGARMDGDDL